jgi:hypothetical protein
MSVDRYGCSLSTENPDTIHYVNLFSSELLCLGKRVNCILEAVEKYPNEIILHIYAAIFYLYGQTLQTQQKACEHLDQASLLLDRANDREKSLYSFAWHWLHYLLA